MSVPPPARRAFALTACVLLTQCRKPAEPVKAEVVVPPSPSAHAASPSAVEPAPPQDGPASGAKAPSEPRRACFPPFTTKAEAPAAPSALRLLDNDEPDEDIGTMHYAKRAVFSAPGATPLVLKGHDERGVLVPLFARRYALTKDRHLFLGWTSWGSGEQSNHAWVIERSGGALRVAWALKLSAHRGDVFFVLHRDGSRVRVGVPAEPDRAGVDEPWVTLDGKAVERTARPAPSLVPAGGDVECFYPPVGAEQSMRDVPGAPLVWFEVG